MEIIKIHLDQLHFRPEIDIKNHDEVLFNKLRTAIQRNGQPDLIHVVLAGEDDRKKEPRYKDYQVVIGTEIVKIMRELGLKEVYAKEYYSMPEAMMSLLEHEIRFQTDYFKVAALVKTLNTLQIPNRRIQHSVPWSETELNNLAKMHEFDWEKFGEPDTIENQIALF